MQRALILVIVVLVSSLVLFGSANAQLADPPWPCYMHDARHTGQSQYVGPDNPAIKWKYHPDMDFTTDPVIDKDGIMYVVIHDETLCAINPDKTVKWRFKGEGDIPGTPVLADDII
jgi:hypothetical protein